MSILENLKRFYVLSILCFFFCFFAGLNVQAATQKSGTLMQWGGDISTLNRKTHIAVLRGSAYVYRDNEWIKADSIDLNTETDYVHAVGRVQYQYGDYLIHADSADIDMKARTGTIYNGNLTNGQMSLRGSRMDQVGDHHFLIKNYNYTTCHDCPNSWEMTGKDVDLTIDGYAFIKDFGMKVKDASVFWLPYMVFPIKSKRQSGFLSPRWGSNQAYGFYAVEPYFWAINSWSDMTLGAGYYAHQGERYEWEGRYALSKRSQGVFNLFWTRDKPSLIPEVKNLQVKGAYYRYALKGTMIQELPWGFEGKLKLNEVSDSGYPSLFTEDIAGLYEPSISTDLFFTRNDPNVSTVISFRRIRNLLRFDANDNYAFVGGFDGRTVQEVPRVVVTTNDQFWLGQGIATGVEARFNRFTRAAGPFDTVNVSSFGASDNVIREGNRLTLVPNMYTTLNPWPWLSVVPSLQYRTFLYNFNGNYPDLARAYPLAQVESSLQLEKIYASNDPKVSFKHLIRPQITYSNIPVVQQSTAHPFIYQVESQSPGRYFDDSDIVPKKATHNLDSYFAPLGNSLTYGFVTQVIRQDRSNPDDPKAVRRFELGLNQTFDIQEYTSTVEAGKADNRIILSPLFSHVWYGDQKFYASADYTYYSYLDRYKLDPNSQLLPSAIPHKFNTSVGWTWNRMIKDGILKFDRSVSVDYAFSKLTNKVSTISWNSHFSINDYVMPRYSVAFSLVTGLTQKISQNAGVLVQSPSKCWQLNLGFTYDTVKLNGVEFDFGLNFSGTAFAGTDDPMLKK